MIREWTFLGVLTLFLGTIFFSGLIKAKRFAGVEETAYLPTPALCVVKIRGAVKNPGIFKVLPGTSLEIVVKKSSPLPEADLENTDLGLRIESPIEVVIPVKKKFLKRKGCVKK